MGVKLIQVYCRFMVITHIGILDNPHLGANTVLTDVDLTKLADGEEFVCSFLLCVIHFATFSVKG